MQFAQKQAFTERMSRIQSRGANTCGVVHVGNTSNASSSRRVLDKNEMGTLSRASLMFKGLRSAVFQVFFLGTCLTLYIRHVGL